MVGGFALTAVIVFALYAVGRLTGHWLIPVGAVTALPIAISMVGWVEIFLGSGFADLANRLDRGGILVQRDSAHGLVRYRAVPLDVHPDREHGPVEETLVVTPVRRHLHLCECGNGPRLLYCGWSVIATCARRSDRAKHRTVGLRASV